MLNPASIVVKALNHFLLEGDLHMRAFFSTEPTPDFVFCLYSTHRRCPTPRRAPSCRRQRLRLSRAEPHDAHASRAAIPVVLMASDGAGLGGQPSESVDISSLFPTPTSRDASGDCQRCSSESTGGEDDLRPMLLENVEVSSPTPSSLQPTVLSCV